MLGIDCSFFSGDEAQLSTTGKQSTLFSGDKSEDTWDCSIFSGDLGQLSKSIGELFSFGDLTLTFFDTDAAGDDLNGGANVSTLIGKQFCFENELGDEGTREVGWNSVNRLMLTAFFNTFPVFSLYNV